MIILLFILSIIYFYFFTRREGAPTILSDGEGYYAYLPALLINHNLTSLDPVNYESDREYLEYPAFNIYLATGRYLDKYPIGTAILLLPLFLISCLASWLYQQPLDGYSIFYQFFIGYAATLYLILGLCLLYKLYRVWFSNYITWLVLGLLLSATSLFIYIFLIPVNSHIYSFFAISLSLHLIKLWSDNPKSIKLSLLLGASFGLNLLIRNSNLSIIIFWLLVNLNSSYLLKYKKQLSLVILALVFISLPQFIYIYAITNRFLIFTYLREGFNWFTPNFYGIFFSPRRGLFFWAPIFWIILFSISQFYKLKSWFIAGIGFLLIHSYIIASWHQWWYGNAYGHRAFIDSYPVLGLFLGAGLTYLLKQKKYYYLSAFFIFVCIYLNFHFQSLFLSRKLPADQVTIEKYLELIDLDIFTNKL